MTPNSPTDRDAEDADESTLRTLTRRDTLKLNSGAALGIMGFGLSESAAAAEPTTGIENVIEVPAGETYVVRLEEREDNTFENTLVDASADGAGFRIQATGPEWTIRNVGIKGPIPSSVSHVIRMRIDSSDGVGTVDNVYIEDVTNNFMFTHAYHEGHIDITNSTFIDNTRDQEDTLYGSPPGNPEANWPKDTGRGGTIHVENCYSEKIGGYGWRMGSDGSKVVNCTLKDVLVGLANLYGRSVEFRDVDVVNAALGFRMGDHVNGDVEGLTKAPRTVVDDVRIDADSIVDANEHQGNSLELVGRINGNPDPTPPETAPTSVGEAASGSTDRH
jgi:hypothetical protein